MSMAYSLYLQCAEGTGDPEWKVIPVSGPRFWQRMYLQMVQYKCSNLHYPGDEKMRKNTQTNKKKRGTSNIGLIKCVCVSASGYEGGYCKARDTNR